LSSLGALAIVLLLCLASPCQPGVEISMEFRGESELEIRADVRSTDELTLIWSVGETPILGLGDILPAGSGAWESVGSELKSYLKPANGTGCELSFTIDFPILDREVHVFPVPACEPPLREISVLLPRGWTSDSARVEKRLDQSSGRILLIWRNPGNGTEARLLRPGSRLRIFLATLIAGFPFILTLASATGIIGLTIYRIKAHSSGNGVTKEL
jgi:hypothetical protein